MKNLLSLLILLIIVQAASAQTFYSFNEILKTTDGSTVPIDEVISGKTGTVLVFWELNDPRSDSDLENTNELWIEKLKPYGINLVSVCVDKTGNWLAVKPYVSGKGWEFDTYIDMNGSIRRIMEITEIPYTIIFDNKGYIKCRFPGYYSGDETHICDKILKSLENNGTLADL